MLNKLPDAWIGHIAGCLLGKPVPIDTYIDQFTYQFITDQGVVSIPNGKIGEYTLYLLAFRLWHNERWYFSIVDICEILTDSPEPRKYWSVLKTRLKKEESELTTIFKA